MFFTTILLPIIFMFLADLGHNPDEMEQSQVVFMDTEESQNEGKGPNKQKRDTLLKNHMSNIASSHPISGNLVESERSELTTYSNPLEHLGDANE